LFPARAHSLPELPPLAWPPGVPPSDDFALASLDATRSAFAWWETAEAAALAQQHGARGDEFASEAALRCHDKAFAQREAAALGLEPACWRGLTQIFEPDALTSPRAAEAILTAVGDWPAWTRGRFALKPRFGTSGRGRAAGATGDRRWRDALPRLAARGGAVLEPWVERHCDLAAELVIRRDGRVELLGSLLLETTAAGVPRGHRARWLDRSRCAAGTRFDAELERAALALAEAAARAGYRGACGVDAFVFAGPDGHALLRPVVELNARFTLGHAALAVARRLAHRDRAPHAGFRVGLARETARARRVHPLFSPDEQRAGAPVFEALGDETASDAFAQGPTSIDSGSHSA
jgi:hypothetical protein